MGSAARVPVVEVARLTANQASARKEESAESLKTSEAELYAARAARWRTEVLFELPGDTSGVDGYVFAGPTMREAVQRYNLFSGGGAVPPLWGLGLKFRSFTQADQALVLKTARALRAMKIPCDMLGLEPDWQSHAYYYPGGSTVTVTGSPGEMPLFVRENSLLPLAEPVQQVGRDTVFAITVKAFGSSPAPFTLFEDDGTPFDFESGAANRVVLTWTASAGGKVERTGAFSGRWYNIRGWESVRGPSL
jgi:alpha-glucosidase (family GH31 glycosyl hydrolase)